MLRINTTDGAKSFSQKYAGPLWIVAGAMFVFSGVFGNGEHEHFAIGMMFIILGIVFSNRERKLKDANNNESD